MALRGCDFTGMDAQQETMKKRIFKEFFVLIIISGF